MFAWLEVCSTVMDTKRIPSLQVLVSFFVGKCGRIGRLNFTVATKHGNVSKDHIHFLKMKFHVPFL